MLSINDVLGQHKSELLDQKVPSYVRILARDDLLRAVNYSNVNLAKKYGLDKSVLKSDTELYNLVDNTEKTMFYYNGERLRTYLESLLTYLYFLTDTKLSNEALLFRFLINLEITDMFIDPNSAEMLFSELVYCNGSSLDKDKLLKNIANQILRQLAHIFYFYSHEQHCTSLPSLQYTVSRSLLHDMNEYREDQLEKIIEKFIRMDKVVFSDNDSVSSSDSNSSDGNSSDGALSSASNDALSSASNGSNKSMDKSFIEMAKSMNIEQKPKCSELEYLSNDEKDDEPNDEQPNDQINEHSNDQAKGHSKGHSIRQKINEDDEISDDNISLTNDEDSVDENVNEINDDELSVKAEDEMSIKNVDIKDDIKSISNASERKQIINVQASTPRDEPLVDVLPEDDETLELDSTEQKHLCDQCLKYYFTHSYRTPILLEDNVIMKYFCSNKCMEDWNDYPRLKE